MSQPLINPNQKQPKEKKADSRQWYQKKRWMLPIGFFVFASLMSAITGGGDSDSASTESASPSETASETASPTEEASEEVEIEIVSLVVPDLVGQNAADASEELEAMGFLEVNVQDATREERIPFLYSNWFVCEMRPGSGQTLDSDKTIVLLSVKNSESCPVPGSSTEASQGSDSSAGGNSSAEISAGTYVVGTEVEPGLYRSSRYWSRLDANQEIIDNDLVWGNGWSLVQIQDSDKFIEFSGVAYALEDMPLLDPIAEGFTEGTYLVGVDIQPGTYRVNAEGDSMAYGSRLACDRDILDNDLNSGSVILTVKSSDCMFEFRGILEKLD
ncbi:MAG: hypothetical protein DCO81_03665 [Candidatus Aquiluna sp. XM-24bin5]|nr:MAG: hypothetical protein DCO81_03665 [Candidatus Aquiluna sp. XM-24bin5]